MPSKEKPFKNREMQQYFSSLPPLIKESIEQSGITFESTAELRSFVENLNRQS